MLSVAVSVPSSEPACSLPFYDINNIQTRVQTVDVSTVVLWLCPARVGPYVVQQWTYWRNGRFRFTFGGPDYSLRLSPVLYVACCTLDTVSVSVSISDPSSSVIFHLALPVPSSAFESLPPRPLSWLIVHRSLFIVLSGVRHAPATPAAPGAGLGWTQSCPSKR